MKRIILSLIMVIALCAASVSAQDTKPCEKKCPKTECTSEKKCEKKADKPCCAAEKKCDKKADKPCCKKGNKKCTKK